VFLIHTPSFFAWWAGGCWFTLAHHSYSWLILYWNVLSNTILDPTLWTCLKFIYFLKMRFDNFRFKFPNFQQLKNIYARYILCSELAIINPMLFQQFQQISINCTISTIFYSYQTSIIGMVFHLLDIISKWKMWTFITFARLVC